MSAGDEECPLCGRGLDWVLGETVCGVCLGRLRGLLSGVPSRISPAPLVVLPAKGVDGVHPVRRAMDGGVVSSGLAAALEAAIAGQLRFGDRGPSSTSRRSEAPLPLAPRAVWVRDELVGVLAGSAAAIATARGLAGPRRSLVPLAGWLLGQLSWLGTWVDGPDHVMEMTEAVVAARSTIDRRDPADRVWLAHCDCGRVLHARQGEETVTCRGCGLSHSVLGRQMGMLREAAGQKVTAAEAARALSGMGVEVTPSMVRGWVHRGHLAPVGSVPSTSSRTPTYRLGDVWEVARRVLAERDTPPSTGGA